MGRFKEQIEVYFGVFRFLIIVEKRAKVNSKWRYSKVPKADFIVLILFKLWFDLSCSYKFDQINSSLKSILHVNRSSRDEGTSLYVKPRNDIQKDFPSLALIRTLCSPMKHLSKVCFKQDRSYKSFKSRLSVEQLLKFDQFSIKIKGKMIILDQISEIVKIYDCLLRENNAKDEAAKIGCGLS